MHMIDRDPSKRLSASEYLQREKGKSFPETFYNYLWPFYKQFVSTPIILPDDRIRRLDLF